MRGGRLHARGRGSSRAPSPVIPWASLVDGEAGVLDEDRREDRSDLGSAVQVTLGGKSGPRPVSSGRSLTPVEGALDGEESGSPDPSSPPSARVDWPEVFAAEPVHPVLAAVPDHLLHRRAREDTKRAAALIAWLERHGARPSLLAVEAERWRRRTAS